MIGVRLSAFDFPPFQSSQGISPGKETGKRRDIGHIHPFGTSLDDPTKIDYEEIFRFLDLLRSLGVWLVNITAGSPYYNPHITRPAAFPPSDGYPPPEDPLVGVVRHINTTTTIKERYQDLIIIGSAYSYLQEWLPHVAQSVIRLKLADFIGLGRMILSYPELPADILAGRPLDRKRICRTFSDCTTAPRKGLISGCYPLDSYYKNLPEAGLLSSYKKEGR
jgi:2,4-dienoyl-CoA reductase-like NADH-dependent reductase (Old Yellow Enzyme family)